MTSQALEGSDEVQMPFPKSFTTTPFERSSTGRFEVCSCKPTPGGLLPFSIQHRRLALAFVTPPSECVSLGRLILGSTFCSEFSTRMSVHLAKRNREVVSLIRAGLR